MWEKKPKTATLKKVNNTKNKGYNMNEQKPTLDSLMKGAKLCLKCGSRIKKDEIGHKCEIIPCPKTDNE